MPAELEAAGGDHRVARALVAVGVAGEEVADVPAEHRAAGVPLDQLARPPAAAARA